MILTDKTQCRSCIEYGRIKGLDGFCCIGVDDKSTHCEIVAKRSNCWCFNHKPNGNPFHMKDFHIMGKYFSERYGTNVILCTVDEEGKRSFKDSDRTYRVSISSTRLLFPISALFTVDGGVDTYSYDDVKHILKSHEKNGGKQRQ